MISTAPTMAAVLLVVYVAGVAAGLLTIDAPLLARVGLALVWPLGPVAFVATIALLIAVALVAFPVRSVLRR